ncbi:MAG: hypothetical protein V2A58_06955 [Planctomycetota bacterium]
MDALSRTHRGFPYTIAGRFLDIHRGMRRLARLDLRPRAELPDSLELHVPDAAGDTKLLEIRYALPRPA